jgi:hypothetical protein
MVYNTYQLPPKDLTAFLYANIWWLVLLVSSIYARAEELYMKNIECVDDIWDSETKKSTHGRPPKIISSFYLMIWATGFALPLRLRSIKKIP